jgi:uncharacterized protein (TIGR03083 family)
MMVAHIGETDGLGAWALGGMDEQEAAAVEEHLATCPQCAAEAGRLRSAAAWLGTDRVQSPPARLRATVLAQAWARRPPAVVTTLVGAYQEQVVQLDHLLERLTGQDWRRSVPRHDDLTGLITHLAGNDAMLASDLGLPVVNVQVGAGGSVRDAWRAQADALVAGLADLSPDRRVRLAGPGPAVLRPLPDALVQRAFETWTHREDIAGVIGAVDKHPSTQQVRRIIDLAVALLPDALEAHGVARPGRAGRLVVDGPGEGDWTFPLGGQAQASDPLEVTIVTDPVEFARLVANRRTVGTLQHEVRGDQALAADVLRVAATLGCD